MSTSKYRSNISCGVGGGAEPVAPGSRSLLEQDVVQLAIIARPAPVAPAPAAHTARQWFDSYFLVVDARTASQLPE